jgi:thermostable 8-oxoguanine DNA glycosylase
MINPRQITDFNRSQAQLEEFFMFCVIVAGKNAHVQATKLEDFLKRGWIQCMSPFEYLRQLKDDGLLEALLREHKLGQYKRITTTFMHALDIEDLSKITVTELEKIPGIGPKTARFFVVHSRPNQKYAVLDTHILSWMRDNLDESMIPKSTPQVPSRYNKLERLFLKEAMKRKIDIPTFDLEIWNERAVG